MIEQKNFCVKRYYKTKTFQFFKQETEGSSISTHLQTIVRFSNRSITLKLMAYVKIVEVEVPHYLVLR